MGLTRMRRGYFYYADLRTFTIEASDVFAHEVKEVDGLRPYGYILGDYRLIL